MKFIKQKLNPSYPIVNAYLQKAPVDKKVTLSVSNDHIFPVVLKQLVDSNGNVFLPSQSTILPKKSSHQLPRFYKVNFMASKSINTSSELSSMKLIYNILSSDLERSERINMFPRIKVNYGF